VSGVSVKQHPAYPFRPGWEAELARCEEAFLGSADGGPAAAGLLREFTALTRRFAFLERLIQGDILYDLPVHFAPESSTAEDPEREGERLAAAERDLLEQLGDDAGSLAAALDEMGIKVLALDEAMPESGPAEGGELWGAFSYEGSTGPALFAGTPLGRPEAAFILAHEFAHLVADINPYQARFCRWERSTLRNLQESPEEIRADRFARALLIPEPSLRRAWELFPPATGAAGVEDPRFERMAAYFEVPSCLVLRRVLELDLHRGIEPGARPDLGSPTTGDAERSAPSVGPKAGRRERGAHGAAEPTALLELPERFVNLVLASYYRHILEIDELALFLRTSDEGARQMLSWAGIVRPAAESGGTEPMGGDTSRGNASGKNSPDKRAPGENGSPGGAREGPSGVVDTPGEGL